MSEDSGEKTKRATPKKIRDARNKGQVGQSQDLSSLMVLAAITEVALTQADDSMQALENMVAFPLHRLDVEFVRAFEETLAHAGGVLLNFTVMTVGLAIVTRLVAGWIQVGFLFAPEALQPDPNRLNPVNQAQQMFSGQALINLFMGLVKAVFIGTVIYLVTLPALGSLVNLVNGDLHSYWRGLASLFRHIMHICLGVLLVLAILDFGLQKYFFAKRLRMSEEEVRKEFKEMEGDPHVKMHRRSLARQLVDQPVSKETKPVEDADMLVVNPTHFAVALLYRPEETALPQLIVKGVDAEARALIERAKAARVPVIQCIWLARTIYREDVGGYIPRETLQAVAHIYRVLRELDDEAKGEVIEIPELNQR
ncbi:type III secretion system export apparatus subunit SctU [Pseudomonas hefeiensis]|uniref:Type III secretion system export apparatus subunit SctU n=1 Tax=Pseudomonas hefeiensis TaxID=2738125 RepID=A0ABY9GA08_9PSED|nr:MULTISPECIES: type III secretion system export apparatus subunit SctU [unclassified Pseudomonas]WLH12485.1 type III secretion system export apparatus subunit SctU [Pseudomonas sp. FP205]WLH95540.1 type III secretion system export apparatus subunit SctU [Pseudomonas sp. FP53]WLI39822.1 type III secretion system export apparatus subunit SctU [Pseudomonas sp. FP821]